MKCETTSLGYCSIVIKSEKFIEVRKCIKCCIKCDSPCGNLCKKALDLKDMIIEGDSYEL